MTPPHLNNFKDQILTRAVAVRDAGTVGQLTYQIREMQRELHSLEQTLSKAKK